MIPLPDLVTVAAIVAAVTLAAGVAGLAALRLVARRPIAAMLTAVAVVTVLAGLAGVLAVAYAMFISAHDRTVVVVVVAVGGLAGAGLAAALGRRVSAASRDLLAAVRGVADDGAYVPPVAPLPAELAALSGELAAVHARLALARDRERRLEASRRDLVAWVSHDLRTPLAGLRAMAEALEDGVVSDPATTARYHTQIRHEVDRLAAMVDDLFELARIQAGALRLSRARVGLDDLLGEALASTDPLARAKGVRLDVRPGGPVPVEADAAVLGRALRNLVVNAIRHTSSDGTVEVAGAVLDGMAAITVSDGCGGIPEADLPKVFDVAFRGQPARTPDPDRGAGLGLAIARGIVEAHAGRITVTNAGAGCRFVIRLPLPSGRRAPAGAAATGTANAGPAVSP